MKFSCMKGFLKLFSYFYSEFISFHDFRRSENSNPLCTHGIYWKIENKKKAFFPIFVLIQSIENDNPIMNVFNVYLSDFVPFAIMKILKHSIGQC